MSRRHRPPTGLHVLTRFVAAAALMALAVALPAGTMAQDDTSAKRIERKWQLLEYRDAGGDLQLVPPGIGVTALPFAGALKGEAACSTFESSYTLAKENFFVDPPAIEYRGCDSASQAIDDAFYQGLADTRTWSTSGSILTLRDEVGEVVMTLTRAELPADPTLARWDMARIGAADGSIEPVIAGVNPWIEFLRGGRVVGNNGCGSFLGSYSVNDSTIRISDVAARLSGCTSTLQEQAERIVATLAEISDFEVLPAGLVLEDAAGTTRLAMVPAIDLGRRTWTPTEVLAPDGKVAFGSDRLNTSAVRFAGNVADGRSICRGFKGGSLRSGLALSAFDIKLADGSCGKPPKDKSTASAQDVEDAFMAALRSASSHALRGSELELLDVEGRPVMRLTPQSELVGPTWVVAQMDVSPKAAKQRFRAPRGDEQITATFEDIGVIQGFTGANDYIADYTTPGAAQIEITDAGAFGPACTKKAGGPLCAQERAFLALLESADSFIVRPEDLRFFKGTRPILRLVPAQTLVEEAP